MSAPKVRVYDIDLTICMKRFTYYRDSKCSVEDKERKTYVA